MFSALLLTAHFPLGLNNIFLEQSSHFYLLPQNLLFPSYLWRIIFFLTKRTGKDDILEKKLTSFDPPPDMCFPLLLFTGIFSNYDGTICQTSTLTTTVSPPQKKTDEKIPAAVKSEKVTSSWGEMIDSKKLRGVNLAAKKNSPKFETDKSARKGKQESNINDVPLLVFFEGENKGGWQLSKRKEEFWGSFSLSQIGFWQWRSEKRKKTLNSDPEKIRQIVSRAEWDFPPNSKIYI